ncbi:hypothetical protein J2T57_001569 [Natronocella acetinitrilica]|uniref:Uncharacterized protein n=1 Tax=Natronocella acetinitrilica TaxID=414046 RepID=A0AAE3KFU6_9GAMM|nr:hypothetical protein [Natronocella acetinitrilica]MCP1674467.1 hypothetical protein [Natronocella acetinitrilica]
MVAIIGVAGLAFAINALICRREFLWCVGLATTAGAAITYAMGLYMLWFDDGPHNLVRADDTGLVIGMMVLIGAFWGAVAGVCVWLIASIPGYFRKGTRALAVAADEGGRRAREDKAREASAYAQIADEIDSGRLERGTWVQAFERAGGDKARAEAEYIRLRKGQMLRR